MFIEKNLCLSGRTQFKSMLFKGQMYKNIKIVSNIVIKIENTFIACKLD